jgi:hypothetical protein
MKLTYALLITYCMLSHYFQAHLIEVHSSSTLGEILNNRGATRKIDKWAIEFPCMTLSTDQGQQSRLKL